MFLEKNICFIHVQLFQSLFIKFENKISLELRNGAPNLNNFIQLHNSPPVSEFLQYHQMQASSLLIFLIGIYNLLNLFLLLSTILSSKTSRFGSLPPFSNPCQRVRHENGTRAPKRIALFNNIADNKRRNLISCRPPIGQGVSRSLQYTYLINCYGKYSKKLQLDHYQVGIGNVEQTSYFYHT